MFARDLQTLCNKRHFITRVIAINMFYYLFITFFLSQYFSCIPLQYVKLVNLSDIEEIAKHYM